VLDRYERSVKEAVAADKETVPGAHTVVDPAAAIVGGGNWNAVNPALLPVPPGLVTLMLPVVPAPTTAVIVVAEVTVKEAAAVPPKLTAVAPVKLVPVRVTVEPLIAEVGVKLVTVGAKTGLFLITETVLLPLFATAKSGLPSPSKSPIATEYGFEPVPVV
jgi:hypothetical protein